MISIGPGAGDVSSVVSLRASASFDASRGLLVFTCHKLEPGPQDELPVIVAIPSRRPEGPLNITFSFIQTAFRVGQLLDLQRASELTSDGELEVQIHIDGAGFLGSMQYSVANPFRFPAVLPIEYLVALAEIDRQMPIPCFTVQGLERVAEAAPENRSGEFEAVKTAVAQHKPSVTSITLRLATASGQDYREEFLGCLPIGRHFSAPKVTGDTISQDELIRLCASGEQPWKMTMTLREDGLELAEQIRGWMRDPTQPFPFRWDNDLEFHYCKTRMEVEHLKHIDRLWYVERRVIFRFSPATKAEQYRVEREYWRSKGDERRAELLEELVAQEGGDAVPPSHGANSGPPETEGPAANPVKPDTADDDATTE